MALIKIEEEKTSLQAEPKEIPAEKNESQAEINELTQKLLNDTETPEEIFSYKPEDTKNFAAFLDKKQEEINRRRETLEEFEKKLLQREQEFETSALKRQTEQTNALYKNLQQFRKQELEKLHAELDALRLKQIEELNKEFTKRQADLLEVKKNWEDTKAEIEREHQKKLDDLSRELNEFRMQELKKINDELEEMRKKKFAELEEKINRRRETLTEEEKNFEDAKTKFEQEKKNLEFDKLRIKKLEETLQKKQVDIDSEIQAALDDRHKILEVKLDAAKVEEENLREALRQSENELANFQSFITVYGNTPEVIQKKIDELRNRNAALVEELGKRPSQELQSDYERLETECIQLRQSHIDINKQLAIMQEQVSELQTLRNENTILKADKENLKGLWEESQETIESLQARINRLTAAEMTPADWNKRAASLREPYLKNPFNAPQLNSQDVDEISWLNRMETLFNEYGISFPRRLLYAFHTSFKIANWSTLTVLAGVSGTGKSELPRLYSAFGGFNFINVPVQPNWDSQESMLGFFNSIDNKFDAQPVLRFLVECTENYCNNMAVVLLDEMNLAHVEHYFADFLSKLEMRRSSPEDSVPEIYVNLGAGVKPYELPLKRNILWCGTMNQDETTKSLSDKVLDRGIVINFPRPRELKSRKGAFSLESFCAEKNIFPMSVALWESWRENSIKLQGDQLKKLESYRHLLEMMNEHLSHAGRAIGHRVWQSIEHYVINYPTVRTALNAAGSDLTGELTEAVRIAVEDQIVQKVMPKLRGIETRGKSYEKCLVPIRGLLNDNGFNLNDDFDRACEMGYGQFMWNSAEYIGNAAEPENGNDK